jgi:hypothetical protein
VEFAAKFALLAVVSSTDFFLRDTNVCSILPANAILLAVTNPTIHTVAAVPAAGLTTCP